MQKLLYALPVVLLGVLILVIVVYKDILLQDQGTAPSDATPTTTPSNVDPTQPPRPTPEPNPVLKMQPKLVSDGQTKVLELWMAPVSASQSMRNLEIRVHLTQAGGNLTAGELELNPEVSEGTWSMPMADAINETDGSVTVNLAGYGSGSQGSFSISKPTLLARVPLNLTGNSLTLTINPLTQIGDNEFKAMTFEQTGESLTVTAE